MSRIIEAIIAAVPAKCKRYHAVVRYENGEASCFWIVPTAEQARTIARTQKAHYPEIVVAIVHRGRITRAASF